MEPLDWQTKDAILDVFLSGAQYLVQEILAWDLLCDSNHNTKSFTLYWERTEQMRPLSEILTFSHRSGLAMCKQLNNIF